MLLVVVMDSLGESGGWTSDSGTGCRGGTGGAHAPEHDLGGGADEPLHSPGGRQRTGAVDLDVAHGAAAVAHEVVVVVESRERGGSLVTVAAALDRGVPVMAVPGSSLNRAARGVNELLRDGAAPVLDADDVLLALQLAPRRRGVAVGPAELRPRPMPADVAVYRELQRCPLTLDGVAQSVSVPLVDAAMSLARLAAAGWVGSADGWFECIGSPLS